MKSCKINKNINKLGLTLVICGGEVGPKTNTYDKRTVVFAVELD